MLNQADNELLTRVGPGTPMGGMLREYWVPACRSATLEADGAPERIRLFGENFVAFRVTDGRVGFMQEGCPHRCASLALARNEEGGLRCIFHGWKFSVEGTCVDAPTEPAGQRAKFAESVPVRSHPTHEAGGIVWVYMGERATPPRFPDYEFTHLPADHIQPIRGIIRTNWLQGLEALLDSAHVGFLHSANLLSDSGKAIFKDEAAFMVNDGAPVFEFVEQPYGFREGAIREEGPDRSYARVREVALPFFSFIPSAPTGARVVCCSIPIDDVTTAQWYIGYDPGAPLAYDILTDFGATSGDPDHFNADMGGPENLWHQDRAAMKAGHWSGITGRGNAYEDFAVQESMGPIVDRTQEYLGTCDRVIYRARMLLLEAVKRFRDSGELSFADDGIDFAAIRAVSFAFGKDEDWRDFDAHELAAVAAE
ncbi:MAG: Rieske 2Fe-2S domain-containing protein [Candidatus Andeanibacterium colombiense]|uniref:Rieske 2Fe-2S domain-containing protein n=1 Tax=Candidatus Andeanibacterium colombiense TaxID=3121345 RepID=A0AAJ5X4P3_9SPHN|nr:MAG: Rieske 2Fe-2S domain-containing protein [Sphingomonadaceae bacterium]